MFFADIEGHPSDRPVQLALEELGFFAAEFKLLGTYRSSPFRLEALKRVRPPGKDRRGE
jgi:prephenate dehydratase